MGALPFANRQAIRWTLIVLRSIPELVWALVFVRVVGLGPTAGVLAIALTYGGMLGKVYGEILESGETTPTETLLRNGTGRLQAFFYGLLPQNVMELTSYTVYRWECAIRSSVVLGFVGAGGLGQELDNSMKMFNGGEVSTMLIVFILLVALADAVSAFSGNDWYEQFAKYRLPHQGTTSDERRHSRFAAGHAYPDHCQFLDTEPEMG